jgi:hypothetical protein
MPEICTCGAQLPPDAIFCHKCGKPQREMVEPEPQSPPVTSVPPPPPPEPAAAQVQLNFGNPVAVRIALGVAAVATLVSLIVSPFVSSIAAGFFAVFLYKMRTGSALSVNAGVRMGWITGLLTFGLWSVVAVTQLAIAAKSGKLASIIEEQAQKLPSQDPMVQQMMSFFQSGTGLFLLIAMSMAALFVFITGLSIAGGALGAKLVGRS